jgi:circadian clock protein KaiB
MTLRLYVAGNSPRSLRAIETLTRLLGSRLDDEIELEIIDIYQDADRARDAQIIGVPTLVRELPEPLQLLVGDLSDEKRVLIALDLE